MGVSEGSENGGEFGVTGQGTYTGGGLDCQSVSLRSGWESRGGKLQKKGRDGRPPHITYPHCSYLVPGACGEVRLLQLGIVAAQTTDACREVWICVDARRSSKAREGVCLKVAVTRGVGRLSPGIHTSPYFSPRASSSSSPGDQ